jgi:hypothetical protein
MAAFLVRTDIMYIAKSTDIEEDDTIDGVAIIGARVFTTDDQKWYIVTEDRSLVGFVDPSLEVIA